MLSYDNESSEAGSCGNLLGIFVGNECQIRKLDFISGEEALENSHFQSERVQVSIMKIYFTLEKYLLLDAHLARLG